MTALNVRNGKALFNVCRVGTNLLSSDLSRTEVFFSGFIFALLLILKWFYARNQPWDSDEPQHLHVVWAWTVGLLPYRDVFDNHSPLFQALSAPLFHCFGERADIVAIMRWAMLPLAVLVLWLISFIGSHLFSPRIGLWSCTIAATYPDLYAKLNEYRPDVLWTALWLILLAILTTRPIRSGTAFVSGLVLGIAFAVSMKTTFLLLTLCLSAGCTYFLRGFLPKAPNAGPASQILVCIFASAAGFIIVPALVVAFFAWHQSFNQMVYCVITHNLIGHDNRLALIMGRMRDVRFWLFVPLTIAGLWLARFDQNKEKSLRRLFLLLVTGLFCLLLFSFWPLISKQDFLPFLPLLIIILVAPLIWFGEWMQVISGNRVPAFLLPAIVAGVELLWMVKLHPPTRAANEGHIQVIADTLKLTRPSETVIDAKGQTIYRPRAYYYVFEQLTREHVAEGKIRDDIPDRLTEKGTALAVPTWWLTEKTADFISRNYVSVGAVLVLGQKLPFKSDHLDFRIDVPQQYSVITDRGQASGILDGIAMNGGRYLSAGLHSLMLDSPANSVAIIWSRAANKDFSPFRLEKLDN